MLQLYLLAALALPAMVPSGYMISVPSEGSASFFVELTVCSATNHRQVMLDLSTGRLIDPSEVLSVDGEEPPPESLTSELCPFSLANAVALTSSALESSTSLVTATMSVQRVTQAAIGAAHPFPPARGPPRISSNS